MKATLTREPLPVPERAFRYVVDCPHGTTIGIAAVPPGSPVRERDLIIPLLERHQREERCHCANHLRRKYGLPVLVA